MKKMLNENGSSLVFIIIIMCILMVIVSSVSALVLASHKQKQIELRTEKMFYLSDSAISYTKYKLQEEFLKNIVTALSNASKEISSTYQIGDARGELGTEKTYNDFLDDFEKSAISNYNTSDLVQRFSVKFSEISLENELVENVVNQTYIAPNQSLTVDYENYNVKIEAGKEVFLTAKYTVKVDDKTKVITVDYAFDPFTAIETACEEHINAIYIGSGSSENDLTVPLEVKTRRK